jgi:antitoxin (DNA-binding transcriptional repressor) of toxin-antitoxin stability system
VLDRVRHGETIGVTNHGELAALLVPPNLAKIDQLVASGRVRRARLDAPLGFDVRVKSVRSTAEVLADLRGDR